MDCIEYLQTLESGNYVILSDPDWATDSIDWAKFLSLAKQVTEGGTTVLVWSGSPEKLYSIIYCARMVNYTLKHIFIWYKPNGAQPTGWGIARRWESVLWFDNLDGRRGELKYLPDVWTIPRVTTMMKEDRGHQWQKPKDLCEMLVLGFSMPAHTVIDPFCGSGAILKTAKDYQRRVLGCDIDPKWVQVTSDFLDGASTLIKGELF